MAAPPCGVQVAIKVENLGKIYGGGGKGGDGRVCLGSLQPPRTLTTTRLVTPGLVATARIRQHLVTDHQRGGRWRHW